MTRRRLTMLLAVGGIVVAVLVAATIGIAASSGGGSSGPITGEAADEAYYDTLAELSETGVSVVTGLTDAERRSDLEDSARELVDAYEGAIGTLDDLRLDDPDREAERVALVERSGPMLDALREAEDAADTSALDAVVILVDERGALLDGLEALANAYRGGAEALREGDGDAYREALERLRPTIDELSDRVGIS